MPKLKINKTIVLISLLLVVALAFLKGSPVKFSPELVLKSCDEATEKSKCWKDVLENVLENQTLDKSFEVLAYLYDTEPEFRPVCHDYVHIIGKKAYELFSEDKDFKVSPKTSYCAYGFYHGFMENMVSKEGDVIRAREFCKKVDSQLSKESPSAELACYHGIGHGWTNVHDQKLWGQERAMVAPAIEMCEKVTEDPHERKICVTGIFDSISIGYYNEAYGLRINKTDPYWLCREQKETYKAPCYMDLSPAILWLGNYDLGESLKYTNKIEKNYQTLVIETLSENSVRFLKKENKSPEKAIGVCREQKAMSINCISGLGSGYLQFGDPGKEEIGAIDFCQSSMLTEEESNSCLITVMKNLSASVSSERFAKACNILQDKSYCNISK